MNDLEPTDTEEEEREPFQISVKPSGVPEGLFAFVVVVMILSMSAAGYFATHQKEAPPSQQCEMTNANAAAQAAAAKANADYNVSCNKRVADLQLSVMKACVDSGNLPILINGNDCKPAPKK